MVLIRGDRVEITRKRSARTRERRRGFWCRKVLGVSRSRRQAGRQAALAKLLGQFVAGDVGRRDVPIAFKLMLKRRPH